MPRAHAPLHMLGSSGKVTRRCWPPFRCDPEIFHEMLLDWASSNVLRCSRGVLLRAEAPPRLGWHARPIMGTGQVGPRSERATPTVGVASSD